MKLSVFCNHAGSVMYKCHVYRYFSSYHLIFSAHNVVQTFTLADKEDNSSLQMHYSQIRYFTNN
jgi:hypothetical protein